MSKLTMTPAEVMVATGPELVEFYNAYSDKPVKRFSNLATGQRRVLELIEEKGLTAEADATRSEAIAESWNDDATRAKRRQRSAVEVDGTRHRSVKAAFIALGLPLEKHIAFRIRLKEKGKLKGAFGHDWKIIPLNY